MFRVVSLHSAVAAAVLALTAGCATALDTFDITRTSTTTIQGDALLGGLLPTLGFGGLTDMNLSQSSEFKNQGVEKHQVDSVTLKLLRLRVVTPAGQDLTFMKKLEFFAESPGLAKVLVATGGPFAPGAATIDLTLPAAELKPYVTADKMSLTTTVDGKPPKQDTQIEATVTLRVDVDVTGAVAGK